MLPAGSKRPIQILQIQNLTVHSTIVNCVKILRLLDGIQLADPQTPAPVEPVEKVVMIHF